MVGRCTEKVLVVRVATHDAIEDDHIGRFDTRWIFGDVVKAPRRAALDAGLADELHRLLLVTGRELEVQRS